MSGTPLDLTPFGGVISAIGWLYWLLALGLLVLAIGRPKALRRKLFWSLLVVAIFGAMPAMQMREAYVANKKLRAATAHFEMRCKSAGEKIRRTVENVEGVVWMKWRDKGDNLSDQFRLDDPYGRDCGAEGCIEQLLRLDVKNGRFNREVDQTKSRYRFVESVDPADGKRYRYIGVMVPRWSDAEVKKHREQTGKDIPDDAYWFKHDKQHIDKFSARYGITWDDISTREDREMWIAGGSVKVVDLQTNEVIAERIGYMVDQGQGSRDGFRSPWLMARRAACPQFPGSQGQRSWPSTETLMFASKVLQPSKAD